MISHYAFSCLTSSVGSLLIGSFVYFRNINGSQNKVWGLFTLSLVIWTFGQFMASSTDNDDVALRWNKFLLVGVIFIPIFFFHFMLVTLGLHNKKRFILKLFYLIGCIFIFLLFSNCLIKGVIYRPPFGYYSDPRLLYYCFLAFFLIAVLYSYFLVYINYRHFGARKKLQLKYLIFATIVGFLCGTFNFLPAFNLPTTPFINYIFATYPLIIAYAIIRHHLMDISVVITRFSIFVGVYSIVLGIPFAMAFGLQKQLMELIGQNWWTVPLITSTVFSVLGPRIYLYFQKRAEDRLLQEQRQYQDTMRKASLGMGRIKDLKRLLNLIVHVVTRTVRIEHCEIFLLNKEKDTYELKAFKSRGQLFNIGMTIPLNSPIIQYLKFIKEPILAEDMEQRSENTSDRQIINIQKILKELGAEIVVPSFIDQRLISLIVLGRKRSEKSYTQDDVMVFSILANQSALAIENALFYEDVKRKNEQLFKAEKMATIGTMADGLSHQINNRLHAMGFIAGDAIDSLDIGKKEESAPEMQELFQELEHAFVRIQKNVTQGGEVVEGLLKWTRKTDEGFGPIELNEIFEASLEMIKFKIKLEEVEVSRNLSDSLPRVKGNFSQLQEVFFNIIDNSYDSMMQRKNDLNEPDYKPSLEIAVVNKGSQVEVTIKDNGIGVKPSDVSKLFTPFFTTKISSRKGTGLGLYVIRQIIEKNHAGRVEFTSDYHKGAQTKVFLPVAA